jgi:Family of unknown function (DUF6331)
MNLDPPLASLIDRCATICDPGCCGLSAFNFSPIHIASYLIMWRGEVDHDEVATLRGQIESLKSNYGTQGAIGRGIRVESMNANLTAEQVDALCAELSTNLTVAIDIIGQADLKRSNIGVGLAASAPWIRGAR